MRTKCPVNKEQTALERKFHKLSTYVKKKNQTKTKKKQNKKKKQQQKKNNNNKKKKKTFDRCPVPRGFAFLPQIYSNCTYDQTNLLHSQPWILK